MNSVQAQAPPPTQVVLRCLRCGWNEFKVTAILPRLEDTRGDVALECARCGGTAPGYLPDVDPVRLRI
jgi:hypothetical protein